MNIYLPLDNLQSQSITALVTDGQKYSIGSTGSELQGNGHIQTDSVGRNWDADGGNSLEETRQFNKNKQTTTAELFESSMWRVGAALLVFQFVWIFLDYVDFRCWRCVTVHPQQILP